MLVTCTQCQNKFQPAINSPGWGFVCPQCGASISSTLEPQEQKETREKLNKQFLHFLLLEELGTGSFGTVWKAVDTKLDRVVSLKIPRKERLSKSDVELFVREARTAAQLKHPNIVTVHEVGRKGEIIYIVSDFIEGKSLRAAFESGRPSHRVAAELCAKIAQALHHAHEAGIVHRDLKPANVIMDPKGQPHIMDFGLAKREESDSQLLEGRVFGTPMYMSPEQAEGQGHAADRRSDIYSLGVILFELLTGERPFRGDVKSVLHQVINETPPNPRKLDPKVPRDLETICLKCLRKAPKRRYNTAEELAADLRRWLSREPIQARPISDWERTFRWCQRNPVMTLLIAIATFLGIGGLAGITYQWRQAVIARDEAIHAQNSYSTEVKKAIAEKNRADEKASALEYLLYIIHVNSAQSEWQANNVDAAETHLRQCETRLRDWEWHYLNRLCHSELSVLNGHPGVVICGAFAPDGRVATASEDAAIRIWTLGSDEKPKVMRAGTLISTSICFIEDGKKIASSTGIAISIWDLASNSLSKTLAREHKQPISRIAYCAKTSRIASASYDGTVKIWDPQKEESLQTISPMSGAISSVAFSPDGTRLAAVGNDRVVRIFDVDSGKSIQTLAPASDFLTDLTFSPDGTCLATAGRDHVAAIWDLAKNSLRFTLRGHQGEVSSVAFSPDGTRLATGSYDQTVKIWDAKNGVEAFSLRGHLGKITTINFRKDGKQIVSASYDRTARIWDAINDPEVRIHKLDSSEVAGMAIEPEGETLAVASGNAVRLFKAKSLSESGSLLGHEKNVSCVTYGPNGFLLASGGEDNVVRIWDPSSGRETRTLRGHTRKVTVLAFGLGGKKIVSGSTDDTVKVWSVDSDQFEADLRSHSADVNAIAVSKDGTRFVSGSEDGSVRLWTFGSTESTVLSKEEGKVTCLAFSPDGKSIVWGKGSSVVVWDLEEGKKKFVLQRHTDDVRCLAFNAKGTRLASGAEDQRIILWDPKSGQEVFGLRKHEKSVTSVLFSADGKYIYSGGADGKICAWNGSPLDSHTAVSAGEEPAEGEEKQR